VTLSRAPMFTVVLIVIMLTVVVLNAVMLGEILLSVVMLFVNIFLVIILNITIISVVRYCRFAQYHYAESYNAEWRYSGCHNTEFLSIN
jgi:hypothetical protein